MGYQENLELYLKFSRKELQALCKKHHLPANKSHSHLAKSLASYLKKRKSSSAAPKERPVNSVGFSLDASYIPVLKTKETVQPLKETTAGAYEKIHFPENDNGHNNGINKKLHHDRAQLQMGISSQMVKGAPEKAFDTAANVVFPFCMNNETEEGFGSSTSRPGIMGNIRSRSAADVQNNPAARRQGFEYHDGTVCNGFEKHLEPSNSGQNLLNHSVSVNGTCNMAPMQYRHKKVGECFTESDLVSSDEITEKATPSLQFFVMSEEGINLFVDLNSTPSAWINSLKDEVCIHPRSQHSAQGNLSNFVDIFDDHRKILPSECTVVDLQNKAAEQTSQCTNSSLSSAISENCQSKGYPPDATAVTSGSSVLTSTSIPVETVGCQEGSVVSSSYLTSDVQKHSASEILSCPLEKVLPQDSVNVPFRNQSGLQIPYAYPKPIGNIEICSADGTKKYNEVQCSNVKSSIAGSSGATKNSEKISCTMSDDIQENIEDFDNSVLKGHKGVHEVSVEIGLIEGSTEDGGYGDRLSNCCQLAGQRLLDFPMTDAQSDAGSADHLSLGNSVPEDSVPTFNALGKDTLVKNTDSSESSQFLDKHSKESNNSEDLEEFQSKRQHACGQSNRGTMTNLSSAKTSVIETQCDFPRRSSRKSKIE
ncbi:uncharacterized protein [Typha angustifolia]|uniref:uncharacterized protein isoform X1 n=1 Tax=Typha angustifolia TaxID=59011 RepID=UPI003C2EC660